MMKRLIRLLANVAFATTIILAPFRWRMVMLARPSPPVYGDLTDFLLFASDVTMLAVLALWAASFVFERRKISFGPAHVWIPLFGLTLAGWFSLAGSWNAPLTIYHALRLSLLLLFFLFIVNEIPSPAWVVIPVALQVLIQSTVAIGQSLLQRDLGLQAFGEYDLNPLHAGTSVIGAGGVRFLRAYGLSDHPNILGGCLALGLLILLAAFIRSRRLHMFVVAFAFVPASLALFLTFSRSAWIAFFGGSLLIVGVEIYRRNTNALKRVVVLMLLCLLTASPFVARDLPYLGARVNADDSFSENRLERGSIIQREYLFDAANQIFVDHALTGVGLGVSAVAFKEKYPVFPANYQPPHFTLLAAALETGILGATFFFMLTVLPLLILLTQRHRLFTNPILIACGALLFAILIIGLFDYYTWGYMSGRYWQWTAWGLWAAAWENHRHAMD